MAENTAVVPYPLDNVFNVNSHLNVEGDFIFYQLSPKYHQMLFQSSSLSISFKI